MNATHGYRQYVEDSLRAKRKTQESIWDSATEYGEQLAGIYANVAEQLQQSQADYNNAGEAPTPSLLEKTQKYSEKSQIRPEILGFDGGYNSLITLTEEHILELEQTLQSKSASFTFADEVIKTRNKLGRPAKLATWLAGAIFAAGSFVGIASHHFEHNKRVPYSQTAERVAKAGAMMTMGAFTLSITAPASNITRRKYAKSRAKKLLSQNN